ncbi:MAG: hypothetical protein FWE59_00255 [Oscillospiraceae bacterium]|nr:hypothetical protein [Oscillospiraceae bacterium]
MAEKHKEELIAEQERNEELLQRIHELEKGVADEDKESQTDIDEKQEAAKKQEEEDRRQEEARERRQQELEDKGIALLIDSEEIMQDAYTRRLLYGKEAYISYLRHMANVFDLEGIEWTDQTIDDIDLMLRSEEPMDELQDQL